MGRRKGSKNKKQIPYREQYWRAALGADRATNDVLRQRKHLAQKEQAAEDVVRAVELEKELAILPPDTLMARLIQGQLKRIRAGQTVADVVDPEPLYHGFNSNPHRAKAEEPLEEKRRAAELKQWDQEARAFGEAERARRLREWAARVDEVMELRKRLKRDAKQK